MHHYLKAIGFGNIESKKELYEILTQVEETFTHHELVSDDDDMDYCEYKKEYSMGAGIVLFGNMDVNGRFWNQYYFPYFAGSGITSYADVAIERKSDRNGYYGICEDSKLSINLIFHVQNILEYLKRCQSGDPQSVRYSSVTLSALSNEGMILLPVLKNKIQERQQKEEIKNRMELVNAAKAGDPAAIESLTLEDIDTYSKVSRRLVTEDIFSIVDTSIMPYGIECDKYSILGTIMELDVVENSYTKEELYIMNLEVNDLRFDLCVPVSRLVGEPAVGRRFKGNVWLQGRINFN